MIRLFSACALLCASFNSSAFAQKFLEGVVSIGVKLTKEETCIASQYGVGDGYHGRRTASGERFNTYARWPRTRAGASVATSRSRTRTTADRCGSASRTAARSSRGCIDLSQAAANAIGMGGIARVTVQ